MAISIFECQRFGIVSRVNSMVNRGCESPILGIPPTAPTRWRFDSGKLPTITATFSNLPAATGPYTNAFTDPRQFFRPWRDSIQIRATTQR